MLVMLDLARGSCDFSSHPNKVLVIQYYSVGPCDDELEADAQKMERVGSTCRISSVFCLFRWMLDGILISCSILVLSGRGLRKYCDFILGITRRCTVILLAVALLVSGFDFVWVNERLEEEKNGYQWKCTRELRMMEDIHLISSAVQMRMRYKREVEMQKIWTQKSVDMWSLKCGRECYLRRRFLLSKAFKDGVREDCWFEPRLCELWQLDGLSNHCTWCCSIGCALWKWNILTILYGVQHWVLFL